MQNLLNELKELLKQDDRLMVDDELLKNRIVGRTGSSEVNAPDYRFLERDIRMAVTRLSKGELLVNHAVYGQPVKIIFPMPAYRQEQA